MLIGLIISSISVKFQNFNDNFIQIPTIQFTKHNIMIKTYRQGAVGALLDEYERAVLDLSQTISDITDQELKTIVDNETVDATCKSIQSVLAHVIGSGYAYAIYIRKLSGEKINYIADVLRPSVSDYQEDLAAFFAFTAETFKNITDHQLEQLDNKKKIVTSWGQTYDIEQITEHAVLHVLRHRRQIEKFKILLRGTESVK
ncbi:putative damage-inducible protein DinB [Chryseobacterium sp. H1D6B]|uniref:DinB family protein n=1 Tax=Chryseobacterium sp. H1D6B TaxID=2940588 RepID=UPI00184F0B6C|nr:DinB family protein [Chryseobacterium sp. H1D6B]MDH6253346.1 putative damage-inducible protein DinB [Chryseobacterium sp. H1D6B]